VIERLAPLPSKPQSVIVERWLPYNDNLKRRVVYKKAPPDPVIVKPRNVIIQWETPTVVVKKDYKYLGVIRANPVEYVQRYGSTLKIAEEMPDIVKEIRNPEGIVLAANHNYNTLHELEGDVDALKLIDLEREGLGEYKDYLHGYFVSTAKRPSVASRLTNSTGLDEDQSISKSNYDIRSEETVISILNSRLGEISYTDD
jgi:hypothetical protein